MRELGPFMTGVWVGKGVKEQIEAKKKGGAQQVTEDQPPALI